MTARTVSLIVRGHHAIDGAGVHLQRVLGYRTIKEFDPFLMLDGFDSTDPSDYIAGFPWHPHRGIETVTYLIHGEIEHGDSLGNKGVIRDLQCQWMTAGSGIIHQEMPKSSAHMLGCQLWINLPADRKMMEPNYHDIKPEEVSVIPLDGALVRVLSGSYQGVTGPMGGKQTEILYLDVNLEPNRIWEERHIANDETVFIYLMEGTLAANETLDVFEEKACAMLFVCQAYNEQDRQSVRVKAGESGARFIILAGKPLKEPIAWGGPIVMNTQEELNIAFSELDRGTFIKHSAPRQY